MPLSCSPFAGMITRNMKKYEEIKFSSKRSHFDVIKKVTEKQ